MTDLDPELKLPDGHLWPNSCCRMLDFSEDHKLLIRTAIWRRCHMEEGVRGAGGTNILVSMSGSPGIDKEDYMEAAARASTTTRDPIRATTRQSTMELVSR